MKSTTIKFLILILGIWPGLAVIVTDRAVATEEEPSHELEPVVVTATSSPTTITDVTSSVTIITREQIEAQHAVSVVEVLKQVPGLYIDQPGGRGGISSAYIRGGDPNYTLVLIDGIEVNDPTNSRGGSFNLSTLNTDNIERIEIVRAPLSALYGSDAVSGVINIITRRGKARPAGNLEVSVGRYKSFRSLAQTSGLMSIVDYSLSASYTDDGEPVEGSEFTSKTLNANIGLLISDNIQLRSTVRYEDIESETFPDDSGGPEFAVIRSVEDVDTDQFSLGLDLTHNPFYWWEYGIKAGIYNNEEEVSSPGVAPGMRDPFGIPPNNTDNSLTRYEISAINKFSFFKGVNMTLGGEFRFEKGSSRGALFVNDFPVPTSFDLDRKIWAPFFEVQLSTLPNLFVQAGVRVDFPEGFDHAVSPRVGASYSIKATNTTLRANWGDGFKLPSFFALGNPLVGNPNLMPETSRGFDFGISQNLLKDRLTLGVTYFYNEFKDAIDFEEGPPPRLVNRSEITAQGAEMILLVQPIEALRINGNLTYTATNIKGTEEELRNRPEWWGSLSIWWQPLRILQINLNAVYVGEVLDSSIPTGDVELDPYVRFDLSLTLKAHKNVELFLVVDNLFDADYEQFVGFPAPGISPRGGIQIRF
ncbi:MAG TPA: TonB-dependent receptor [Thermodesulfobacteriota bacterium]|nr:TonB-dependent receptor [Thermodesulfobacteriota bacterium]